MTSVKVCKPLTKEALQIGDAALDHIPKRKRLMALKEGCLNLLGIESGVWMHVSHLKSKVLS